MLEPTVTGIGNYQFYILSVPVRKEALFGQYSIPLTWLCLLLALKVPITTAADGKFCDIFPNFRQK